MIHMIRGKELSEFDTYFREPYIRIINLFICMKNSKLTSWELRYILLKNPKLSRLKRFKSDQLRITEPHFTFGDNSFSLERIRAEYKHRLKTKLHGSRFKYMTNNGLNLTLRRMRRKVLKNEEEKYYLTPEFYDYCNKRDPNSVLQKLSKRNLTVLQKMGYNLYYPSGDNLLRQVIENQQELVTLINKIQTARIKIVIHKLFDELKENCELSGDWVLMGCILYQITYQIKRVPYLNVSDFTDELNQILTVIKNQEIRDKAEQFSTMIEDMLENFNKRLALTKKQKYVVKQKHPWMLLKKARVGDVVSSFEWKSKSTNSINELVELGIISNNDGVIYKNQYEASLYLSRLGFEKYLKWSFLINPPQIILDFGYR